MQIDHVLIAVPDLDGASREFEQRHGLVATGGGRHPGWGTANRIVPLGEAYLELIAVVDPAEAGSSDFGRWVASAVGPDPRLMGWSVRTDRIELVAKRLGLEVNHGSRVGADGSTLRWRLAGTDRAGTEPALPFFIEWGRGAPHPGAAPATPARVTAIELNGDAAVISAWLGEHDLPVSSAPGEPALTAVELTRPDGDRVRIGS